VDGVHILKGINQKHFSEMFKKLNYQLSDRGYVSHFASEMAFLIIIIFN